MFIALRYSKFRMGMSTTGKVELTAVLYLFLSYKPNINDYSFNSKSLIMIYPTKCYHYENAVLTMLAVEKVEWLQFLPYFLLQAYN